jgi:ectoine hydroxylase-related dioxygenase (phytanoyl-CoA dioxygenase family)
MTGLDSFQADAALPSREDIAFYREHGWWISSQVIPDSVLDTAQLGVDRHYAGERDHPLLITGGYLDWRPEHGPVVRLNDYVSLQNEDIRELVILPVLAKIAGLLTDTDSIRLFHDQLICKPAGIGASESVVGWHVDAAYWQTCSSRSLITAWIPFQDCSVDIGALSFIDRSHQRTDTEWMKTFGERDLAALEQSFSADGEAIQKISPRLRRGQVSFHHCRTIHGSEPNRSQRDRLALAVHFQDHPNHYIPHTDAAGRRTVHINDLLCRKDANGNPDYSDPAICPVLWSNR